MIQATSGDHFEEKAVAEFRQLAGPEQLAYAIVAVATAQRIFVSRDELLGAVGRPDNEMLLTVDGLIRRQLLINPSADSPNLLGLRHRMIADLVIQDLNREEQLRIALTALAFTLATSVAAFSHRRKSRKVRLLARLINNRYLSEIFELTDARQVYADLEDVLKGDYHYWLQRGTFEVQQGDLDLAENFLGQAYALNSRDPFVAAEYAHLEFKLALRNPRAPGAHDRIDKCIETLERLIEVRGDKNPHPAHILGSHGLAWIRRGGLSRIEKRTLLKKLIERVEQGKRLHPWSDELSRLLPELEREHLMTAVTNES